MRTWKQEGWLKRVNSEWAKDKEQGERRLDGIRQMLAQDRGKTPQWFVNGQGQTMVVIPGPVEFVMGSPVTESGRWEEETQHRKRISRTVAIAAKSVTVEQYAQFFKGDAGTEGAARTADLPVGGVDWHKAARYCNWLSREEGISEAQWCYEIEGQVTKLKENYLSLTGYRLPTEAEMEYAIRAGALTSRHFGETETLLSKYAWCSVNSQDKTSPVGSQRPNDLGLFDVHGNVYTWCQERYKVHLTGKRPEVIEDREDEVLSVGPENRVARGGSFATRPSIIRSAFRDFSAPTNQVHFIGFRPARTVKP